MKRLVVGFTFVAMLGTSLVDVAPAGTTLSRTKLILESTGNASDGTVTPDQAITLKGDLISRNRRCFRNKPVELFIDGSTTPNGMATTAGDGTFTFSVSGPHPVGPHQFQAKRKKNRRCRGSRSNIVNVTVDGG